MQTARVNRERPGRVKRLVARSLIRTSLPLRSLVNVTSRVIYITETRYHKLCQINPGSFLFFFILEKKKKAEFIGSRWPPSGRQPNAAAWGPVDGDLRGEDGAFGARVPPPSGPIS